MTVENVLVRLANAKRSGGGWMSKCPAHDDRNPSLSIHHGEDGRVLLHCHAGCQVEAIVTALGLTMADLFRDGGSGVRIPARAPSTGQHLAGGCTLAGYAEVKRLPMEFLRGLHLSEITYMGAPVVRIPYFDEKGDEVSVQFRTRLANDGAGDRFKWRKGSKPVLYGLWRLELAREQGFVVLVEGASDCHTLWFHDVPAIGLPGATAWREDRDAPLLDGIDVIFVAVEPDTGGDSVVSWLGSSCIRERARLLDLSALEEVVG